MVAARHGHPLTRKSSVTLDDLSRYEWVVGTPGSSRLVCFDTLFADRRRPRAPIETWSLATIRLMLNQRDRLTLLTNYELVCEGEWFAKVPFGPIQMVPSLGVTTRANWLPTPLQANFLDLFRKRIVGFLESAGAEQRRAG